MAKERFVGNPTFGIEEVETILDGFPDVDKDAVVKSFFRHADQRFLERSSQKRRDYTIQMSIHYKRGNWQHAALSGCLLLDEFVYIKGKRHNDLQTSTKEAAAVAYSFGWFQGGRSPDADILDRAGVDEVRLARQFGNGLREAHPRSKALDEASFVGIDDLQALPPVVTWSDREGTAILKPVFELLTEKFDVLSGDFKI